jgi:DNA-binding CsgD family transcriptional regulator
VPGDFFRELTIFHEEQAIAQRYFFSYLTIRDKAVEDKELLAVIKSNPWFLTTVDHSLLLATFIALGRIFDQDSPHNIDRLMSAVSANIREFSLAALEARLLSKGCSAEEVARYLKHAHELTANDVRKLRKKVADWRRVYKENYKDIRHNVFAHKQLSASDKINALFAKTKVDELKKLFHFLNSLYLALFASYINGIAVKLDSYDPNWFVGEQVRLEGEKVLKLIVEGARVAR